MTKQERADLERQLADIQALIGEMEAVSERLKRAADVALETAVLATRGDRT